MVYDSFNTPQRDWPVTLDFSGNIAGLSGPAVYVDNLTPCAWTVSVAGSALGVPKYRKIKPFRYNFIVCLNRPPTA